MARHLFHGTLPLGAPPPRVAWQVEQITGRPLARADPAAVADGLRARDDGTAGDEAVTRR
ncbi:hypothetical protein QUV83_16665 [Cellulomonas cellasea]|uniref:hypothetical protein n=1 Tax=Cellulomonas cellasea TaxID=43670 RepID=UPI0025A44390|nr:hypothetical protein [Cellulomonas cellasea]MDM8086406.1 hypothetical protein [Cellulomonas cellasea]